MLTIKPIWLLTKRLGLFFLNGLILLFTLLVDDRINRKKRVALELLFHIFFSPLPLKTTHQPVLPSVSSCGWRYSGTVCAQQGRCVPYLIRLTWRARIGGDYGRARACWASMGTRLCWQFDVQTHIHTHTHSYRARAHAHKCKPVKTHARRWVELRKGMEIRGRP